MKPAVRGWLERHGGRRVVLAALSVTVACAAGLAWRRHRLGGLELLDSRGWYTPAEAAALFDALDRLDPGGRAFYAATGLTVDMVFPVAYGLLFAIILARLFRGPACLLPIALAASDVAENLAVAALALSHAGPPSPLAWAAGAFTLVKTVLIFGTLGATAAGAVRWLWMRFRPPP